MKRSDLSCTYKLWYDEKLFYSTGFADRDSSRWIHLLLNLKCLWVLLNH